MYLAYMYDKQAYSVYVCVCVCMCMCVCMYVCVYMYVYVRQGCCMAPVLFNLFTCRVTERWQARVEGDEGIGITLNFKYDQKLFRSCTRNGVFICR